MPRLRPIDFTNFDNTQGQRMIKDILMKYPRGPQQNQRREEYGAYDYGEQVCLQRVIDESTAEVGAQTGNEWAVSKYIQKHQRALQFGYTPEQVYTFFIWFFQGNRPQHWNLRNQLCMHCPEFGKAKLTRGANRLQERLWSSWSLAAENLDVQKMFKFTVSTPTPPGEERTYHNRREAWSCDVSMVAPDAETAKQLVLAVYGHCVERDEVRMRDIVDWKSSDECDAVIANQNSIARAASRIADLQGQIEKMQKKIADIEFIKESMELYSVAAFEDE